MTAVYFAGVMVRLMLTLTPVVCVLSGIAFSHTYEKFLVDDSNESTSKRFLTFIFNSIFKFARPLNKH